MSSDRAVRGPADFGGRCLVGECELRAELLMPSTTYFGLRKVGSHLLGTWRDADGNLLRSLRAVTTDGPVRRWAFSSRAGSQLEHDEDAERRLASGPISIDGAGDAVSFVSDDAPAESGFAFRHTPDGCSWNDADVLAVAGSAVGPAMQWFGAWGDGACLVVAAKYRARGTFLGRAVEGFVAHEIHYFSPGANWLESPYGRGREFCWQQIANEYDDGTMAAATFACGADGWGFAMLHDESGAFHATADVDATATVGPNGYPETVTYRFLDQSWTWRIDPRGERAPLAPGPLIGADGTCTRDGDDRSVRYSMGSSDWWTDGRAAAIIRS